MKVTIAKISRQLKEGISKKTGKPYSFESLGISPIETTLMDINGDEFERNDRWLSGISKPGTETWVEGDQVKLNLVRATVKARDGSDKEVINFQLPVGVDPMVKKFTTSDEPHIDHDDF